MLRIDSHNRHRLPLDERALRWKFTSADSRMSRIISAKLYYGNGIVDKELNAIIAKDARTL
jgi:hypothetical protein